MLTHSLWVRKAVGLLKRIKSGDESSGKSAAKIQEWMKMNVTRAVFTDLRAGIAFVMAAGSFV